MLDWSQTELASRSNLSESTIRDFEKGRRVPSLNNLAAVVRAFEAAGLEFIPENGGLECTNDRGEVIKRRYPPSLLKVADCALAE
ncbi:MAG: XRE family transcriptional regulator, partial [Alphaproteobacteria bacterium]